METLDDIEKDMVLAFIQAMRGDFTNYTDTGASLAANQFMTRIRAYIHNLDVSA